MAHTHAELVAILASGQGVIWQGQIITNPDDLPSDVQLQAYSLLAPPTVIVLSDGDVSLVASQTGLSFSNGGALAIVNFTLPFATLGLEFHFYCQETGGITVDPHDTDTTGLTVGGAQQAAGKYLTTTVIGAYLHLKCVNSNTWEVMHRVGLWTVEA